jgi:hypothetical protein
VLIVMYIKLDLLHKLPEILGEFLDFLIDITPAIKYE